ncbi:hypothetical protein GCM10010307_09610 [Streptomyces vastus]|uniref:Uncharacterized protein n=1 Tax=Streptomyces vastus TaxID=285451 RepID=A0ABP6CSI1_9ACTN
MFVLVRGLLCGRDGRSLAGGAPESRSVSGREDGTGTSCTKRNDLRPLGTDSVLDAGGVDAVQPESGGGPRRSSSVVGTGRRGGGEEGERGLGHGQRVSGLQAYGGRIGHRR